MQFYLFNVGLLRQLLFLSVVNVLDCNCIEESIFGFKLFFHEDGLNEKAIIAFFYEMNCINCEL